MISHGQQTISTSGRQQRDKLSARYRPLLIGTKLPDLLTEEEMKCLLGKVREGNKEAIETMILGYVRLAISIVNRYLGVGIHELRNYADILDSAALEGVIEAVNRVAKGSMSEHDNVGGYIVKYIHRYVGDAIKNRSAVSTPQKRKDKKIERLPTALEERDSQLGIQKFEAWDLVESLANNETEKRILELKREGYTDSEIGQKVGLSRLQVYRVRCSLFQRYKRRYE